MVYLIFDCEYVGGKIMLNEEWERCEWVKPEDISKYDLNKASVHTFELKGWI